MGDGVIVADETGTFLLFNPAAERILGIGRTDTTLDEWSERYGLYLPDQVTLYPPESLPLARAIRGEEVDCRGVIRPSCRSTGGALDLRDGATASR